MEDRLQPVLELVAARTLDSHFQGAPARSRRRGRHHRRFGCSSPPGCCGRKRGIISNALGRSRGGFSTKIHALVDTKGRPLHVQLTPGQQHESTVAAAIIENHARGKAFIADTGYDSDAIRNQLRSMRIKPVIHANPTRKKKPRLDRRRYAVRYRVEVFFHDLKRFRALATRFEKTSRNYLALLQVACSMIWLQDLTGGA
jgi:transposase